MLVINSLLIDIIILIFEINFLKSIILKDLRIILLKNLNKKNRILPENRRLRFIFL